MTNYFAAIRLTGRMSVVGRSPTIARQSFLEPMGVIRRVDLEGGYVAESIRQHEQVQLALIVFILDPDVLSIAKDIITIYLEYSLRYIGTYHAHAQTVFSWSP
jgi:hypothetical protein